ncbi:MAG: hypothetical protein GX222_02790 [Ruminococcaceae bacterium]|nr:hypothetical protein [Oscillospiraceae bacterium]
MLRSFFRTYYPVLSVSAVILIFSTAYIIFLATPWSEMFLFLLFQTFAVLSPGVALVKIFKLNLSNLEKFSIGYASGIALNILVYFIFAPFKMTGFIPYSVIILSISSLIYLFYSKVKTFEKKAKDEGFSIFGFSFSVLAALLTFFLLSASNLTPDLVGLKSYYHDLTNGVGLITSASFGFPMEFLQMSHTPHYYHPFFYSYCAVMKLTLGFSSFSIGTKYSLITIAPLFVSSFTALSFKVFSKKYYAAISVIGMFLLSHPMIYYVCIDLLGFSLGLAYSVLAVLLFLKSEESSPNVDRYLILSSVFVVCSVGAKGPIGVTTVFALSFSLLISLFRGNKFVSVLKKGMVFAIPFFAAYFLLYRQGPESMMLRSLIPGSLRGDYYEIIPENFSEPLKRFLSNVIYTLDFHRFTVVGFFAALIYMLGRYRRRSIVAECTLGATIIGILLTNIFSQMGSSEVYFSYASIPLSSIIIVYAISEILSVMSSKKKAVAGSLIAIILILVFKPSFFEVIEKTKSNLKECAYNSIYSLDYDNTMTTDSKRNNSLSPAEYEGLIYLRDNTNQDCIIAEGRHLFNNKFFYGTAFAERRFFLEGWGYVTMEDSNSNRFEKFQREAIIERLFKLEDPSFTYLLRDRGVDYVIVYELTNPGFRLDAAVGASVFFENDEIVIYDISEI